MRRRCAACIAARGGPIPTIDVMSQQNDYEVHYECFIPNVSRMTKCHFWDHAPPPPPPVHIPLRGH